MSKNYSVHCPGHNSIYKKGYQNQNYQARTFPVYFSIPENGVNQETGILLLIAGFSAHANSKVYKKMRDYCADQYNLVTIQCDYFGYEFMQEMNLSNYKFYKTTEKSDEGTATVYQLEINETNTCCNDMGLMQAVDNVTATLHVMGILYDNEMIFNTKKVMIMGQSHGAYLAYLCNIMCPGLYTHILDNSAWVYPNYLTKGRYGIDQLNYEYVNVSIHYLVKRKGCNFSFLDLKRLLSKFQNQAQIIVYHGEDDTLIPFSKKAEAVANIHGIKMIKIGKEQLDHQIFFSAKHGLDADFFHLFQTFYENECSFEPNDEYLHFPVYVKFAPGIYINYENNYPEIELKHLDLSFE